MKSFSWKNSDDLDVKLRNLEDLLDVFNGLAGSDFTKLASPQILITFEDQLLSAGMTAADFSKIKSWTEAAPQELSIFIKSALIVFWIEYLLLDFHGSTALAHQCGSTVFLNSVRPLAHTKTFLHFVQQKRHLYWCMLKDSFTSAEDLTDWILFYLDLVSDFLQENIEDLSHLAFRIEFDELYQKPLNARQKKLFVFCYGFPYDNNFQ